MVNRLLRTPLYDVIVVGAGPAGLLVSGRLKQATRRVLLIEAGPRRYAEPSALRHQEGASDTVRLRTSQTWISQPTPSMGTSDAEWRFRLIGAAGWWPRAYAVGGRGNLWGGWLSRFDPEVFREGGWPYGARSLAPCYRYAENWLGAISAPLAPRFLRAARALGLRIRAGVFATRLVPGFPLGVPARVRTETVAVRVEPDSNKTAVHVFCGGRPETLTARAVVLAASPIETVRLLLESGMRHPWLGRRLTDHLMLGYVLFEPNRPSAHRPGAVLPAAIIPRFVNRGEGTQRPYHGGYSIELMGPVPSKLLGADLRRLLGNNIPKGGSFTYVNAIGEQWRHPRRIVDLAPRARDSFGRHLPQIHFAWSAGERRMVDDMKSSCRSVAAAIASPGAELVRCRDPFVHPAIFHPASTCAMGEDPAAPCDARGRFRPAPSLWIADASAFPSGGDTHPTLTVLAHALRVAESVHQSLS